MVSRNPDSPLRSLQLLNSLRTLIASRRPLPTRLAAVIATAVFASSAIPSVSQAGEASVRASAVRAFQQTRTPPPRRAAPPPRTTRATPASARAATGALRATTPVGAAALESDLASMIDAKTRNGSWGVMVVSLSRGDTLFSVSPDTPFVPASTMKAFTAALALERLGPDYAFSTDVLRDGALGPDGVVHGNMILRGDGDPALSTRFVRGGADAPMELLARFVAGAGVKRVTGDLIADASGMETRRIPDGWLSRYAGASYAAPFSALSLNENMVIVGVQAAKGSATVKLEPATSGLQVVSSVRVVPGRGQRVQVRMVGESQVVVTGSIGASAPAHRVLLVVSDPVTFTAGAFREALRAQGIAVDGEIRIGRTPDAAVMVTSMPSPPLSRLISVMNRESINHLAEQIYRNAARGPERNEPGTAEHAYSHLRAFIESRVGIAPDAVVATDGSGLSVLDRVTPRALVQLMHYGHHAPWSSVFHGSFPVAGESETLRLRMRNTAAQGNLHAKTGTTNDVISLAGYVTAENGEILAFAFMYNGADRWNARETIDVMGATMAGFSR